MSQTDRNGAFSDPPSPPEAVEVALAAALAAQAAAEAAAASASTNLPTVTHAAASKNTPVDADEIPLVDSAAAYVLKKLTWVNLKATLKTYFDTLYASLSGATFTGYINEARGTVTMHATTMDLWAQPNTIDGTGSAVTITAIANAPQAGAKRTVYVPAGTKVTNGATFAVDGNADYTAMAGDGFVFEAVTTSTYKVHITKQDGTAVVSGGQMFASEAEYQIGTDTTKALNSAVVRNNNIINATTQLTTSGTAKDFTGIPAWAKEITIMFYQVGTNGTSDFLIQIGDAGGIENTGYVGGSTYTTSASATLSFTAGFGISTLAQGVSIQGRMVISLLDAATFKWSESGTFVAQISLLGFSSAGTKALSAALDRVRITTVNGTDTFNEGSISVSWK